MQMLIISYIAESIQSGRLKKYFLIVLRKLVTMSTNKIDDQIVELVALALENKEIDEKVTKAISEALEVAKTL